jgi:hypothetical protein
VWSARAGGDLGLAPVDADVMKGIGASFDRVDVTSQFVAAGVACLGYTEAEASDLYSVLRSTQIGELVYIKSHPQGRLYIKAVGIVTDNQVVNHDPLGFGISVRWIWRDRPMLAVPYLSSEGANFRSNSIYDETNPRIQALVTNLLIQGIEADAAQAA